MGYPLPDMEAIDGEVCVNLILPNEPNFLRAFWGQVYGLTHRRNWSLENAEVDLPAARAAAEFWRQVYADNRDANIEYVCGGSGGSDDAPYWDNEETLEGEGEGEKWGFTEAADWVVTAFLATTVHPAAGMFYKTVIPRGRIAFKSHDFGGLARILVDGIMAIEVDTESVVAGVEQIIEVDIDLAQFAVDNSLPGDERTIEIVKVG